MKCILSVFADSASLDNASNRVSLFGVIDGVSALTFPHTLSSLAILFLVKKEAGDKKGLSGHVSLSFQPKGQQGEEIQKGRVAVNFDFEGKPRLRVLVRSEGISLEGPGTLIGRLWHKDIVMGEWTIEVTRKKEFSPKPTK